MPRLIPAELTEHDLKVLFAEYLEHSLRYYIYDAPVIGDDEFDALCKVLLANFRRLKHKDKRRITRSDLEAGTGMKVSPRHFPHLDYLVRKYPDRPLRSVFLDNYTLGGK